MKTLCIIALFILCLGASGQQLSISANSHDFGAINDVATVHRVLTITNTGVETLFIGWVKSSCSCVSATVTSSRLVPGDSTELLISLQPAGYGGPIQRMIMISSNSRENPILSIDVLATISPAGREDASPAAAALPPTALRQADGRRWREGEVLVKFRGQRVSLARCRTAREAMDVATAKGCRSMDVVVRERNLACMQVGADETVEDAVARLAADPDVEFVQPNYYYEPREIIPNDPEFATQQYALKNTGQVISGVAGVPGADIEATYAWEMFTGNRNGPHGIVALLDAGFDYNHPELVDQLWDGAQCVDENGQFIGGCIHGYDYTAGDSDPKNPFTSSNDHGTHIAGILAAAANNEIGITGIVADVRLMIVRSRDFVASEFVKGIYFAGRNGATIISASWGWGGTNCTTALDRALYEAVRDFPGMFVVATGNSATENHDGVHYFDTSDHGHDVTCNGTLWPALPNMISVTRSDNRDALRSAYGALVDIAAPGEDIYSASYNQSYTFKDGTSMSTPHVTGVVGLLWGFRPNLTASQIRLGILANGDCIGIGTKQLFTSGDNYCGSGRGMRVNAYNTLAAFATPTVTALRAFTDNTTAVEILDGGVTNDLQPYWTWAAPTGQGRIRRYIVEIDHGDTFSGSVEGPEFDAVAANLTLAPGSHAISVVGENDRGALGQSVSMQIAVAIPSISFGSTTIDVGEESDTAAIVVNISQATSLAVSVDFETVAETEAGRAIAGLDYTTHQGTLTWPPDSTAPQTITIPILDDALDEYPETLRVRLLNPTNAILDVAEATIMIVDNDDPPGIAIDESASVDEFGDVGISVFLSVASGKSVSFDYETIAVVGDGKATAGEDFTESTGTVVIDPGTTTATIMVPITEDQDDEGNESFIIEISNLMNAVDSQARSEIDVAIRILDNDLDLTLGLGWNLISIPILLSAETIAALTTGNTGSRIWDWDNAGGVYQVPVSLKTAAGYWVYHPNVGQVLAEGQPGMSGSMVLERGWNLVGVGNEVAAELVLEEATDAVWGWDGDSFAPVSALSRKQGYWLYSRERREVALPE